MSDSPTTTDPARSSHRLRRLLLVGLLVVLVVSLAVFVRLATTRSVDALGINGEHGSVAAERDQVRAQAEQFLLRMGTYGPDLVEDQTMPQYRERVTEVITPKFATSFEEQVVVVEQLVVQAEQSRTARVFGSGVAEIDDDTATVLVAGSFTDTYADAEPQAPSGFRIEVALVRVDDDWLVDGFAAVGGAEAALPDDLPTEEPEEAPEEAPEDEPEEEQP